MNPLHCTWSAAMDFDGLNQEDRARIAQIGFDAWLDEVAAKQQVATPQPIKRAVRTTKRKKTCPCGRQFPGKREDAIYCSARCRQRASRHKPNVTDRPAQQLET